MVFVRTCLFVLIFTFFSNCKKENKQSETNNFSNNEIKHAKGFELYHYNSFSLLKITQPWPNATDVDLFVLQKDSSKLPDSLQDYPVISIPLNSVVVTSTTHIPSLEMLGTENTLVGFPNTDYISSEKTRKRIDKGLIKEIGSNESLNTEVLIDLQPDVIVGFGINGSNNTLNLLEKTGQKIIFNGDWVEQSPLGKAEWIKFFGALYNKNKEATIIFNTIEKNYNETLNLIKTDTKKPTVLCGAIYQDRWYLPKGNSWASLFIQEAHGDYLWSKTTGAGSLSLSFETVFDKGQNADYWIGPSSYCSLQEMKDNNPHYNQFKSFQEKKVYSYGTKKGKKGGLLYYELAPNRPDIVLKDILKILHPEWIPNHELYFFEKLK